MRTKFQILLLLFVILNQHCSGKREFSKFTKKHQIRCSCLFLNHNSSQKGEKKGTNQQNFNFSFFTIEKKWDQKKIEIDSIG